MLYMFVTKVGVGFTRNLVSFKAHVLLFHFLSKAAGPEDITAVQLHYPTPAPAVTF